MQKHEQFESVPGILRPFRAFIESAGLKAGDQVVYYGIPGTCTPFVELLAFAIRALPIEQVFVPGISETKAQKLVFVPDAGMQVEDKVNALHPRVIVLMGGLSMPNSGLSAAQVHTVCARHKATLIGLCFMHMFEKSGWLKTFDFDLLIDATISPVDVWTK